ncbi:hypothetical protein G647_09789 [Cladophialophora carrionii CBS 160.54]|uniref:Uncharacterized protein n=1 Tax=Cladophialophora carrionii CBS 160.54 TaxID=1279043 RepID=V9DMC4_9EURO|nr:uncharacterized protein G647_09789 [Cladophialophora carrionii CBS 160.54]ETI27107.1 hypothetical protein G647_09789 [Cladophialophora carrionii CBS 160.54]
MATRQANNYTRREIEAAETLVSFHNKIVEFVGPRDAPASHQLHPVMVPHLPAGVQSTGRQQMPPPPRPPPFPASRQVNMAKCHPRDTAVRCTDKHRRCLSRLQSRLCTESRFWDKERSTGRVKVRDRPSPTTMVHMRPWRGHFLLLLPQRHLHHVKSEVLQQRGLGEPSQHTRTAVTCATTPSRLGWGRWSITWSTSTVSPERTSIGARLEDTKVQMLW